MARLPPTLTRRCAIRRGYELTEDGGNLTDCRRVASPGRRCHHVVVTDDCMRGDNLPAMMRETPNALSNRGTTLPASLVGGLADSRRVRCVVGSLMESGVRQILTEACQLVDHKVPVTTSTGTYLGIPEPSALSLLMRESGPRVELGVLRNRSVSFPPKAYLIDFPARCLMQWTSESWPDGMIVAAVGTRAAVITVARGVVPGRFSIQSEGCPCAASTPP